MTRFLDNKKDLTPFWYEKNIFEKTKEDSILNYFYLFNLWNYLFLYTHGNSFISGFFAISRVVLTKSKK